VIAKPGGPHAVAEVADRVVERIRALRSGTPIRLGRIVPTVPAPAVALGGARLRGLIAIGASTGGTQAIETVLTRMPAEVPPIVIAQHMPAGFTRAFAERLDGVSRMRVVEAAGGETLERGTAYVAPGDHHLTIERQGLRLLARLDQHPPMHYQRPAVDALFQSAARLHGVPIVALLLTGMGVDGADGMVALREAGAETIAEAEESCVVFGMPKAAIARGGAGHVASLLAIPELVVECLGRLNRASRAS
jgi:two-component system chemotaxis response regulator CheB